MGQEQIAHICTICRKAFKARKKAKQHVSGNHIERVKNKYGPGQHVSGLWLDLRIEGEKHEPIHR